MSIPFELNIIEYLLQGLMRVLSVACLLKLLLMSYNLKESQFVM